ncbi:MAG: S9 family peptidase [Kordiimonadaceae bacterium]|nr:S9 family peptidase [Kordiimonadaceae bacterium]
MRVILILSMVLVGLMPFSALAQKSNFEWLDVFELEYASDPQFTDDGKSIVYVRNFMDIMKDRKRSNLWRVDLDGGNHRPITSGLNNNASPRFSPDGSMLAYTSNASGNNQVMMRLMDAGETFEVAQLQNGASRLTWSPDGQYIAFNAFVPGTDKTYAPLPNRPKGAEWAKNAIYIDKLQFRNDGRGFVKPGKSHVFVVPAMGGTPRQITSGEFNHSSSLSWAADGSMLYFSANRHDNHEMETRDSEIYSVDVNSGDIKVLTSRFGPDGNPSVSPNGNLIAYSGYDDKRMGAHNTNIYVMNVDGSDVRNITGDMDRSIGGFYWSYNGRELFYQYTDKGMGKIAKIDLKGKNTELADHVSGTSFGRPYASGAFNVSSKGDIALTYATAMDQSNIGVTGSKGGDVKQITDLNGELLNHRKLGSVEEVWYKSSHDGIDIHGWLVKPVDFDPAKKYPLILEIHGGPFSAYGPHFSAEIQLMANLY